MLSRVIFYSRLALHVKFLLPILHHRLIIDSSLKKLLIVIEARQLRKGFLWERVHVGIIPHCIALPLIHHVSACIVPIVILLINLLYRWAWIWLNFALFLKRFRVLHIIATHRARVCATASSKIRDSNGRKVALIAEELILEIYVVLNESWFDGHTLLEVLGEGRRPLEVLPWLFITHNEVIINLNY
jgi:hypothetical protein